MIEKELKRSICFSLLFVFSPLYGKWYRILDFRLNSQKKEKETKNKVNLSTGHLHPCTRGGGYELSADGLTGVV